MSKGPTKWTAARNAKLVLLRESRVPDQEIARHFRVSVDAIHRQVFDLRAKGIAVAPATSLPRLGVETQARTCLTCGRSFASEGKHNRICAPCKALPIYRGVTELTVCS